MEIDVGQVPRLVEAANLLRAGALVAFPTETVYGLGADATSDTAVRKIFAAKGRPAGNPLIVHVADISAARKVVTDWPDAADRLAHRFWPGPLTLVLTKATCIANVVTAGGSTVGVRVPNHLLALELLRAVDRPIAAPSANSSERISPTTALHVKLDLGDKVDFVLDGGPCTVGIESTVLDLSASPPMILRPGAVTRQQIEAVIGPVNLPESMTEPNAKSPGRSARHYAPRTPAYRFEPGTMKTMPTGAVSMSMSLNAATAVMPNDPDHYAAQLYDTLRQLDGSGATAIYIELPPDEPRWLAVRDRLMRAAKPVGGDDVACPMCGYSLRGLAEPRCPECGFEFDWAELLDPLRQKHPYLFEHYPRSNVWSFFKTQIGGYRPKEFWTSLHPAQPSNALRLACYVMICDIPAAASVLFSIGFAYYLQFVFVPQKFSIGSWSVAFRDDWIAFWTLALLVWPILTFAALLVFQSSLRRSKMRFIHAFRSIAYSADTIFLSGTVVLCSQLFRIIPVSVGSDVFEILGWFIAAAATVVFIVLLSVRLTFAYRYYLRFSNSFAMVFASQLMAGLAVFKLYLMWCGY